MSSADKTFVTVHIRKRPALVWAVAAAWLALVLFFLNTAMLSGAEMEPKASLISYITVLVLLVVGVAAYMYERNRAR